MSLVQLVYTSKPSSGGKGHSKLQTLREVHAISQQINAAHDVTGFLAFDVQHYIQVLEGKQAVVNATYDRIQRDPRHTDLKLLDVVPIRSRMFGQWSMGASFDPIAISEIMLSLGLAIDKPLAQHSAASIIAVFSSLAERSKVGVAA